MPIGLFLWGYLEESDYVNKPDFKAKRERRRATFKKFCCKNGIVSMCFIHEIKTSFCKEMGLYILIFNTKNISFNVKTPALDLYL